MSYLEVDLVLHHLSFCKEMNFCLHLPGFTLGTKLFFTLQPLLCNATRLNYDHRVCVWLNLCRLFQICIKHGPIWIFLSLQWLRPWAAGTRPHAGRPHLRPIFTGEWREAPTDTQIIISNVVLIYLGKNLLIICCRTSDWHHLGLRTKILRNCPQ